MHHYLQVEELGEPEEAEEIGEVGELKAAKKTMSKSCMKDIYQQSRNIVDLDKCLVKPSKILIPYSQFKPCKYSNHVNIHIINTDLHANLIP
jgi:hypothetical protein